MSRLLLFFKCREKVREHKHCYTKGDSLSFIILICNLHFQGEKEINSQTDWSCQVGI